MTELMARGLLARPLPSGLCRAALIGGLALALGSCGVLKGGQGGPKTPVAGTRTSILSASDAVDPDAALANVAVTLPLPLNNPDWAQPGGDAAKAIGHVGLGSSLSQAWSATITGSSPRARLASTPVVAGGKLYVIDTEAQARAFDARTGAALWSVSVRASDDKGKVEFGGGVSVEGDRLYVTTGIGDVAALEAATGKQLWKVRPGGPLRGAATLSNGQLYVMSQDNQVFALGQQDGNVIWTDAGTLQTTGVFGVAAPAAGQGTVIAGFSSGELTAYRYENGRVLWGDALSRTSISTTVAALTDIDANPVIDRGRVFAIGEGGRMASYELVSGQRLWEINVGGVATPAVVGDWVFVVTDKARLLCISRTSGRIRWISQLDAWRKLKKKEGTIRWTGPVLAGGRLVLVSTEGNMAQVDPVSGNIISAEEIGKSFSLPPVVANAMLYLLSDDGKLTAMR